MANVTLVFDNFYKLPPIPNLNTGQRKILSLTFVKLKTNSRKNTKWNSGGSSENFLTVELHCRYTATPK